MNLVEPSQYAWVQAFSYVYVPWKSFSGEIPPNSMVGITIVEVDNENALAAIIPFHGDLPEVSCLNFWLMVTWTEGGVVGYFGYLQFIKDAPESRRRPIVARL